jgi:hypothetical protein
MEQSSKESVENKDEELWDTAKGMARGTWLFRFILAWSILIVVVSLYLFIMWGRAKLWTWQDVCVSFAIFYIAWGLL